MASALACPSSFKGFWSASEAAAMLAEGLGGADTMPVADGGEGTLEALFAARGGEWRTAEVGDAFRRPRRARWLLLPDGTACVEAAEAIPLDPARLDAEAASSRGLGELIEAVGRPRSLLVALGGTATMEAGVGLGLRDLPSPTRVAVDTDARLLDAPRLFGPQKGVVDVEAFRRRFASLGLPDSPGGGAAGGLGAALAALGAELVPGAALVLDELGFDPRGYDLVVTGEGAVDGTSARGKATGEVARRCAAARVRCAVVAARVEAPLPGAEAWELEGRSLVELGALLAETLS